MYMKNGGNANNSVPSEHGECGKACQLVVNRRGFFFFKRNICYFDAEVIHL